MQWPSNLLIHKLEIRNEKFYQKRQNSHENENSFLWNVISASCYILEPFCSIRPFRESANERKLMDEIIWRYLRAGVSSILTEPNRQLNVPFCVGAEGDEVRSPWPHTVLHKPFTLPFFLPYKAWSCGISDLHLNWSPRSHMSWSEHKRNRVPSWKRCLFQRLVTTWNFTLPLSRLRGEEPEN